MQTVRTDTLAAVVAVADADTDTELILILLLLKLLLLMLIFMLLRMLMFLVESKSHPKQNPDSHECKPILPTIKGRHLLGI